MISYISASWIYPVSTAPLKNGVIAVHNDGTIISIFSAEEAIEKNIQEIIHYEGYLIPGLVNTHCHLELSYLKGYVSENLGLTAFLQQVIQLRDLNEADRNAALTSADEEMYVNGIVAVGDIANTLLSKGVKLQSKLYYHTFIEVLGFNPANAKQIITKANETRLGFYPLKTTIVPHAPYTVSPALFNEINFLSGIAGESVSIHNQESAEEDLFLKDKGGKFIQFYESMGLDISFFSPLGKSSLQSFLPMLSTAPKTLLVHNTFTSAEDLEFAKQTHKLLYWCLCPNANLYIENRLPDIPMLKAAGVSITLGTDSLASNHQLSILSEMLTLQQKTAVSFEELLSWATLNGAEFLGIDHLFGSLETGKKPGINWIQHITNEQLTADSKIQRLF